MERILWVVIILGVIAIGLCIFGIVSKDNPMVELATDVVCDVTDDMVCEEVEGLEGK